LARNLGVRFYILEGICPDEITRERLEKRTQEIDSVSDGRWEFFQEQKKDFDTINEVADDCYFKIDTSANPEITRQGIIRRIKMEN
jgi:hypothetical protein